MEVKGPIGQAESLAWAKSITLIKLGCIIGTLLVWLDLKSPCQDYEQTLIELEETGGGVEEGLCPEPQPVVPLWGLDWTREEFP